MSLSLKQIESILFNSGLIKEYVHQGKWYFQLPVEDRTFYHITYDSRQVGAESLFFCKGLSFKQEYLETAILEKGLNYYISENPYDVTADLGIIVTDIREALALLSMAFYDYPQNKLTLIGYTGTKGKTTASYFTKAILDQTTNQRVAMLSTMNTTLDGKTFFKSELTTPESLDLYRMMAEAVTNGMTHMVMEVSSQAYKVKRAYGLVFDIGIFMNISPDHIGPIEHPTFDDYYYCKRQLIKQAKKVVIFKETKDVTLLIETADAYGKPYVTYGHKPDADFYWQPDVDALTFHVSSSNHSQINITGEYRLQLRGDFNKDNALASLIVSNMAGASKQDSAKGLKAAKVPGRMEHVLGTEGEHIYVDYAHNYDSLKNLLSFAEKEYPDGKIITVIGSTGNKGVSRRKDFGKALSELGDTVVLTEDDPQFEDPKKIINEISEAIYNPEVKQFIILDREEAIKKAIDLAAAGDVVILAGKGQDRYQKKNGKDVPYKGDYQVAQDYINEKNKMH
ncbi:UDP-N-acetylmuramoyl-L-alanyl-D-glutamate--L-lysine ligase [Vagococcus vulneris]|uniref:UDP-N-acetylmuramyl-tripeptide synthetase n=1 Tax=Vagococcus vulneris TaxID=1977869 RepID=A0A430A2S8_9ENTE|nr:UDP-N-acetylmuramoyl-L-alanyl-D-glutamate--L-lysine ligase [Vagococcus vulneris]RSU00722.1 UDP-N-acetylmuramoylalanyl-D-glutamate--L-lysine ligase [Vagococcus vulneris]